ncbi:MAG: helix-turn-helix transcriptional regulator [Acidobacteriota bacterium]
MEQYRRQAKRTQQQAARDLGVSQTYLSLLENGKRPVNEGLETKAVRSFGLLPTELAAKLTHASVRPVSDDQLAADLAALGYEGFSHLRPSRSKNPADVLLSALNCSKRDARLVEALPWVVLEFPNMPWARMMRTAKAYDLQNRLGFVTNVARRVAELRGDMDTAQRLKRHELELEHSLLVREETLCNETMTNSERKWLAVNRSDEAQRWHLLTDLSPKFLSYYE